MSTSIRKKYITYNHEKNAIAKSKESNLRKDKSYNTNTYIIPKLRNKEKYEEPNEKFINHRESKRQYNLSNILSNNLKSNHISNNNINNENANYNNYYNHYNNMKNRRNLSQDFMKRTIKNDINNAISVIFSHESEKIKSNLLKYLINNDDINTIFTNIYEIIEDLIDEYNVNNNYILDKEENKKLIDNKYQLLKNNIMNEYKHIYKEIYSKYYLNKKDPLQIQNRFIPLSNFKKHCINSKDIAMHKSKFPLFLIPNTNYIICKQTNDIYHKNCIECFCEYDGEIYISSYVTNNNIKNQLIPLTHRNSLEDRMCLCSKCNHVLYFNNRNKKIKCIKCNNENIEEHKDIFYNELFFSKLKEEINFSISMKRKSNPSRYCTCGGIFYQGKFLDKYILVCSLCKKCQYDKRNGRYKYRLYLFKDIRKDNFNRIMYHPINEKEKEKENKNKEESKLVSTYKGNNRNKINNSHSHINIKEETKIQKYNEKDYLDIEKINKIPKLIKNVKTVQIKVIQEDNSKNKLTNYNRFINSKYNNSNNNTSELINEEYNNKNNITYKYQINSGDVLKNKRELVKKKAKLLLSNNSSNNNLNPFVTTTTSLVASRKERALKGTYLEHNENSIDQINKLNINKLLMNSLDQNSFKALIDNIDPDLINDIKNELTRTLSFKKTLTNNNSNNKLNIDNINRKYYNNHTSTSNIYRNINSNTSTNATSNTNTNTKTIFKNMNKKFVIPSNLNMNDYKIINLIGTGSFSNIYQVQNNKTKKKFAIKKIIVEGQLKLEKYKQDIELVQSISKGYFFEDINIIPIIQYFIKKLDLTAYALYELMPLAESDWNKKILKEKKNFTETELIKILKQISKALCYMQNNKICHRDIKPSNIFIINSNYYIGDFNESIEVNGNPNMITEVKGTEAFLSPIMFEALVKNQKKIKNNLFKSDVYSFGLCFVFAITRNLYVLQKIKETKQDDKIKKLILDNRADKKIEYSHDFVNLIVKLLCWDENNRMDFIELNNYLIKMNI